MTARLCAIVLGLVVSLLGVFASPLAASELAVRISWGHRSADAVPFQIGIATEGMVAADISGDQLEAGDRLLDGFWQTRSGAGDVDGVTLTLQYPEHSVKTIDNLQSIWAYLIEHSDSDTARRLRLDPAFRPDPRKLTLRMARDGTKGFSLTVDQLLQNKAFWVPALDIYVTAGDPPLAWADHIKALEAWNGQRVLDRVHAEPEATYEQYTARWEDMASPRYQNSAQQGPGHIVGLTWDSAIYKFGIDRGAGAWNDLGNPDKFQFGFGFGELSETLASSWRGQSLADGLPVLVTVFERDGVRYEVEQFAYPLHGPPADRRGDIPMVLLQNVTVTNGAASPRDISITLRHRRARPASARAAVVSEGRTHAFVLEDGAARHVLFSVEGDNLHVRAAEPKESENPETSTDRIAVSFNVAGKGSHAFVVKLPSPIVRAEDRARLRALDYAAARRATVGFWSGLLAQGAQFRVPEKAVNDLFRANLWHARRLPRRHGGQGESVRIDLPYSNFAYGQDGTPWPVNQAVYVDYMLYDLRGYHEMAAEELGTIYRNNQEANGHIGGYANWGVYTPSMIYVVAKNYRLSGDRAMLDRLLPQTLKALDWCLAEIQRNDQRSGPTRGLVGSPLNDLTGEGVWAFTQGYMYAALEQFACVLRDIDHPRAAQCAAAAERFGQAVTRSFQAATVRSPLVPLRDHTWIPYVPCEASKAGRLFAQWYPTDVDTGAVHLLRLKALDGNGALAESLLNDHEDNLYLHGWGMANEPVYNQQATAYLLRDDPKAVIRAFYSYMACAFSHSVFEPVEHRWGWGQYFGPPSTDGAWFDLYRHMLIHERDDDTLLLLQAPPRAWLGDGKTIDVRDAPTTYGRLSMRITSRAASDEILAEITMPDRKDPKALLVRLRHPAGKPVRSVTVNGENWTDFDVQKEWVRIARPGQRAYSVVARY